MAKFLLLISALIAACAASDNIFYSEKYIPKPVHVPSATLHNGSFPVKLDHFRPHDGRLANFHYRLNLDHYIEGGPIFVFISAVHESTTEWIEEGLVVDVARRVGGCLVTFDHRYGGLNIPTETASFDDLTFLSIEQALADIAVLVSTLYEHLGKTQPTPVITWGTGLGGTLAALARKKYPHLITGAFASSGIFRPEVFDTTYHDNLSANLLLHGSANCHLRVQNAFDVLLYLFENGEVEYIQERLRLCEPVNPDEPQEVAVIFEIFIDLISNYIRRFQLYGITSFCRDMDYFAADSLNSFIRWAVHVYGFAFDDCIRTNYQQLVERLVETDWDTLVSPESRSLAYLRCTQIAAFRITSDSEMNAFPSLLTEDYHFELCEDIFGEAYNRSNLIHAVQQLNIQFGGQEQVVPFVIFTNAALDPWISHGVSEFDQENGAVIFLYYATAGQDLSSITQEDSAELTRAKQQIFDTLIEWTSSEEEEGFPSDEEIER